MSTFEDWPYRWFGNFREQSKAYALCPSILEFVDPAWDEVIRGKVINYLENAFCLTATSRFDFPRVFEGRECLEDAGEGISFCVLTDGVWTWNSNLSHYARHHCVRVPDAMVKHMVKQSFRPPAVIEVPEDDWIAYSQSLPHAPMLVGQDMTPRILSPRLPRPDVAAIRSADAAAFCANNFPQVVALYGQIERELSPSERRKVELARDRLTASSQQ